MLRRTHMLALAVFCLLAMPFTCLAGASDMVTSIDARKPGTTIGDHRLPRVTNQYGMTFVHIPPGEFLMGSPPDEPGRQPNEGRHKVVLSRGFYIMTTEVTQKQWAAVMGNNPSAFSDCGADCPVENVSWSDVSRFIEKLNAKPETENSPTIEAQPLGASDSATAGGKSKNISSKDQSDRWQYHLPTEAQWEYACRAGSRSWFFFEGDIWDLTEYAWYKNNADQQPHPVAKKKANAFGLYDVHGNVWEWCRDYAAPYATKDTENPTGPNRGAYRIVRGGSWYFPALEARCANRLYLPPDIGNYNVGFRLVMTAAPDHKDS